MATTAPASPATIAAGHTISTNRSATPPHQDPSASQSVASTSSVTLDEPNNTTSKTAIFSSQSQTAIDADSTIKQEEKDEDARLLASLANDISNGASSEVANLVELVESTMKAETLKAMAVDKDNQEDRTFSGLAEDASGPIQAYAKLEFPGFSYYIQTLDCTIGRRPAHMRTPSLRGGETQHITGAKKMEGDVDVDLGLLKSISRLHVRIFYQDQPWFNGDAYGNRDYEMDAGQSASQGRFVLQVLGRNGCFVDDVPAEKDAIVPLGKRTKIQIAERVFYFVLPPASLNKQYNSDGELGSDASQDESEEDSGSLGSSEEEEEEEEESASSSSEEEDVSEEDEEMHDEEKGADTKKRPKLVLKKKPAAAAIGGKGKGKGKGKHQGKTIWEGKGAPAKQRKEEDEQEEEEGDEEVEEVQVKKASGKSSAKKAKVAVTAKDKAGEVAASARKRKRGNGEDREQTSALKVGTPIGVETLSKSKKKKKVNGESANVVSEEANAATSGKGSGKGAGKAHIVAAALAAKAKTDEEKGKATASLPAGTVNGKARISNPSTSVSTPAIRPMTATSARPIPASLAGNASPRPLDPSRPLQSNVRPASSGPSGAMMSYNRPLGAGQVPRPIAGVQQQGQSANGATSASPTPFPPSSAAFAHLTSQNRPPPAASSQLLPPAGPGIKPDHSNIDLIREALSNPISLSRGGKLTLQEIYEDISSRHEWYRNNNRANGRDWHSSIRHAVGNSKDMVRIPKKPNEQGKGVFYAFSGSEAAKAFRLEEQANGISPSQAGLPTSPTPPVVSAAAAPAPAASAVLTTPRPPLPAIALPPPPAAIQPPSSAAAARPSPPIQPNGRVSIVIGKAPAVALAQHAALPKSAMTKNIEMLFKGPPIVHHEGTLYLNPVIFGHMSASEVNDIGGKGAQTALALLQGQLVKHLQTVMKPGQGASPRPARPPIAAAAAASGSGTASPHTPRPAPLSANGMQAGPAPAPAPRPSTGVLNRPVQGRLGPAPPPPGAMPTPRPGPPVSTASPGLGRPPSVGVPQPGRPISNDLPRPAVRPGTGGPVSSRPQQPTGQNRPPTMAHGQPIGPRPMPPTGQASRLPYSQGTAAASGHQARPNAAPSPAAGQQRPLQRPLQTQPLARPAAPITARPAPSAPSLTTRPAPRPAPLLSSAATSSSPGPSVSASPTGAPTPAPSSNAVMSAMSALASHPDAAGLMTLLSGGKVDSGTKLTPAQLDLLQRAGRIAAEQQKAQQQQRQQKVDAVPSSSPAPASSQ